jgi:NADH dehydrogenase
MNRGYHVFAIPTWERKLRVLAVCLTALIFGHDIASPESTQLPPAAFFSEGKRAGITCQS